MAQSMQNRRTPKWFFNLLNEAFGPFALDAFADETNHLCQMWYGQEYNALIHPWYDKTFANPPFEIMGKAMAKAAEEQQRGISSVVLAPAGCSQNWFHNYATQGTLWMPDCRISYDLPDGTPTKRADRDTLIVAFGYQWENLSWALGTLKAEKFPLRKWMKANEI